MKESANNAEVVTVSGLCALPSARIGKDRDNVGGSERGDVENFSRPA